MFFEEEIHTLIRLSYRIPLSHHPWPLLPMQSMCRALVPARVFGEIQLMIILGVPPRTSLVDLRHDGRALG